jgi:hypothetical protein
MEQQNANESARDEVRAALARAGIVLPELDITFLAAQRPMLADTLRAVAEAARAP